MKTTVAAVDLSPGMQALFDALHRDRERIFASADAVILPLTIDSRESSEVARARVTSSAGTTHIFVKRMLPRKSAEDAADTRARFDREMEVTRRIELALRATSDLRAVETLAAYADLLGVVTREAPGVPLNRAMAAGAGWGAPRAALAQLETALERIGRWSAAFQHAAPLPSACRLRVDDMREYIDARLRRLTELPAAQYSDAQRRRLLAYFDRRAADVPAADLLEVAVHGDITPSNIVVSPHCVTVLDFGMTGRGSKYFDLARLFTQLDFYTAKPQFRRGVIARLQQAMLRGFDPQLQPTDPLFDLFTVQHVVCHLLSHARRPGRFPSSLYSRYQCRLHRAWLDAKSRLQPGEPAAWTTAGQGS